MLIPPLRIFSVTILAALIAAAAIMLNPSFLMAQDEIGGTTGSGDQGTSMDSSTSPDNASSPASDSAMAPFRLHIPGQITGSIQAVPPYGVAPMSVGFLVVADDPEGQGFLTYEWNFGDGTVAALAPALYLVHTYRKPGSYICRLTVTTVDGRSRAFMSGIVVKTAGD